MPGFNSRIDQLVLDASCRCTTSLRQLVAQLLLSMLCGCEGLLWPSESLFDLERACERITPIMLILVPTAQPCIMVMVMSLSCIEVVLVGEILMICADRG